MSTDNDGPVEPRVPRLDPPADKSLGMTRGAWAPTMAVIGVVIVAVAVVLILVDTGHLARGWAYAVLPVAIIASAATRVLTIFKAGAEDKRTR